jgi:Domain of unknown function (DUF222)
MFEADGEPDDPGFGSAGSESANFASANFASASFGSVASGSGGFASAGFASVAEALRVGEAVAAYLNSPAARELDGSACGEALITVGRIQSRLAAAQAALLCRFDAADAHDADGYGSSSAWLAGKTHLNRKDAKAAVRQMRLLGGHPVLDEATGSGDLSRSWAREMAGWTARIGDKDLRQEADKILLDAAAAGADLDDLRMIAQAAYEAWRARQPDPDEDPGKGFDERYLQLDTTMDNAGRITGDLTPECAAAVQAVLEALGKKRGAEDDRTQAMRFHDALQEACESLIRAKMVPGRAGVDTRVDVHIGLGDLRRVDGAPVLEEAWLAARAGEHGYLCGKDAETIACDALIAPVVTGSPDWDVIAKMIALVLNACAAGPPGHGTDGEDQPGGTAGTGTTDHGAAGTCAAGPGAAGPGTRPAARPLPPQAWEALQYAMARLAIDFVSGPGALASVLRTGLLPAPYNGKSAIIDVGWSDSIPEYIRRAVILRDKKCAWAGGCDKRPAACDVHHIRHKKDGGLTSVKDCVLLCQFHHDICIHRWGWEIELLPDGSTRVTSPQGQVLRSHGPPGAQAA